MSIEKKVGYLKPETKERLELCLEMAANSSIDLITEAYRQDIFDKKGRGDLVWLYKGAKEALTCMEKVTRILNDDSSAANPEERAITPEMQAAKLLESVTKKLEERKQRAS